MPVPLATCAATRLVPHVGRLEDIFLALPAISALIRTSLGFLVQYLSVFGHPAILQGFVQTHFFACFTCCLHPHRFALHPLLIHSKVFFKTSLAAVISPITHLRFPNLLCMIFGLVSCLGGPACLLAGTCLSSTGRRSEICCVCDTVRQRNTGVDKFHYDFCPVLQVTLLVHTFPLTSSSKKYADLIGSTLAGSGLQPTWQFSCYRHCACAFVIVSVSVAAFRYSSRYCSLP